MNGHVPGGQGCAFLVDDAGWPGGGDREVADPYSQRGEKRAPCSGPLICPPPMSLLDQEAATH